jgi:hypothetical protein
MPERCTVTAPDRLALAVRVMKARRSGVCTICRAPVTIGQSIARLVSPRAWVHVRCVPAVARALHRGDGDSGVDHGDYT